MVFPLTTDPTGRCNPCYRKDGVAKIGRMAIMDVVRPCRPTDVTVRAQASCETRKFAVSDGDFLHPIDINNVVYMPVLIEHVRCYFEAGCEKWMHEMSINFFAMACCRKSKSCGPTWNVFRCSTGQALVN